MPPPERYSVWWRVVGLDLGLKFFTKDQNDNAVIYPQFLRKAEKQLKKTQRRLSKKFVKGAKPQSNNYHKARKRLGRVHLKIQRQRKDWAIKQARNVVISGDVVVYENLQMVRQSARPRTWSKIINRWSDCRGQGKSD